MLGCRSNRVVVLALLQGAALGFAPSGSVLAAHLAPFPDSSALSKVEGEEQRVWSQGDELAQVLERAGVIYENPAATAYVQSAMDRLFPEFKGAVRVSIVKSPQLNAFALPNGRIYINQGLLARFQNEAQLATVMAHEGTHFTNRHGYQTNKSVKDNAAFAMFGAMLGIPILPELIAASSIFGFSREMETEADKDGFTRLRRAGYDVHESPRVFEQLIAEIRAEDIKEPYFFATHPRLQERVDNMKKLSAGVPPGGDGAVRADYARAVLQVRLDNLDNTLSMGRAKSALIMLDDPLYLAELPPQAQYYLGEAYRLRGEAGDLKRAEQAYLQAVQTAPDFAPSYRALGAMYLKANHFVDAQKYLERYLELAPEAPDRKYVESYLRITRKKTGAQP